MGPLNLKIKFNSYLYTWKKNKIYEGKYMKYKRQSFKIVVQRTLLYQSFEDIHHTNISELRGDRRHILSSFGVYYREH